ncbi:4a-hydroxytetrahydrobiopterin dehydratase [Candidatus Saccharibacteria bacterium]|nr:4a-hydroxytetrahydrobiopterin dehydratase [Candidatus Saccharibacteria bacterium]
MWKKQNNQLYKEFSFKDFDAAFAFMVEVAKVAQRLNHHPRWLNEWNKVQFWLYSHSAGAITPQDEALAGEIDMVFEHQKLAEQNAPLPKLKEIKIFADGGSRGNPGPSAGGYVILDMDDNVVKRNGKYLGITTNNQAEYHSIKGGLEAAVAMGAKVAHVYMDSMLVVNQMKGVYKVRNRDLWPIHQAIKTLVTSFERINFTHVPREMNKLADAMVNETLDSVKDK